jgi:hypothetical protein
MAVDTDICCLSFVYSVRRTARALIEQGDVEPYVQTPEEAALIDALETSDTASGELVRAWQATR